VGGGREGGGGERAEGEGGSEEEGRGGTCARACVRERAYESLCERVRARRGERGKGGGEGGGLRRGEEKGGRGGSEGEGGGGKGGGGAGGGRRGRGGGVYERPEVRIGVWERVSTCAQGQFERSGRRRQRRRRQSGSGMTPRRRRQSHCPLSSHGAVSCVILFFVCSYIHLPTPPCPPTSTHEAPHSQLAPPA
jgi:hypothetical protein